MYVIHIQWRKPLSSHKAKHFLARNLLIAPSSDGSRISKSRVYRGVVYMVYGVYCGQLKR
jgi:hypothetical protein